MDARDTTVSLKTKLFSQSFIHLVGLYFDHNAAKRSFLLLSQAFSSSVFLFPGIKLTLRKRPQGSRNQRASTVLQTCDSLCYSETRSQVSELKSGLFFYLFVLLMVIKLRHNLDKVLWIPRGQRRVYFLGKRKRKQVNLRTDGKMLIQIAVYGQ